jgi:hypothetical protein
MSRRVRSLITCGAVGFVVACTVAKQTTLPATSQPARRSPLAELADSTFWRALHGGGYDSIPRVLTLLKAAYLQDPGDARLAAHIGFTHAWRLVERARLAQLPPGIIDEATLAKAYFDRSASTAKEYDARVHGFAAAFRMAEAEIHRDSAAAAAALRAAREAIARWPEFNWFTVGYTLSTRPHDHPLFNEAIEMQWRTMEACSRRAIDRRFLSASRFLETEAAEREPQKRRACWNSWIAPHNTEGFFLNFGDMLVKAGDWRTAQQVYALARGMASYSLWPYRDTLERRIEDAPSNVERFRAANGRLMIRSAFACSACHQAGAKP